MNAQTATELLEETEVTTTATVEPLAALEDLPIREIDPQITLGIETSCDETSVAVMSGENLILSNVVSSSASLHERYGGVVPEIASRAHVQAINPAISEALLRAEVTLWDVSIVAVTVGPGLIGSLIVGVAAAKALASVLDIPLVPVNHLEAHLYANLLDHPDMGLPAIGLVVSGGHTLLVHMIDHGIYDVVGATLDDAAGEAFDKVARMLDLGFPGGPAIDRAAAGGDPNAIAFPRALKDDGYNFSFSGVKTAVYNYVRKQRDAGGELNVADVAASFQEAVVEVQVNKTLRAAEALGIGTVFLSGGVAANSRLREMMRTRCEEKGFELFQPTPSYCTDNAAMVACCGFQRYRRGIRAGMDLSPDPNLPLA